MSLNSYYINIKKRTITLMRIMKFGSLIFHITPYVTIYYTNLVNKMCLSFDS